MTILMLTDPQGSKSEFELVLKATLIGLAVLVVVHFVIRVTNRNIGSQRKYRWTKAEKLVYFGFALSVAWLGGTAFASLLIMHGMHGWWLLAHLTGAGGFVLFLTVMSWSVSLRFMPAQTTTEESYPKRIGFSSPAKLSYWLVLLLCLPVIGTILLSMFPLFGTADLVHLIDAHRYSGLALFSAFVIHFLLTVLPPR